MSKKVKIKALAVLLMFVVSTLALVAGCGSSEKQEEEAGEIVIGFAVATSGKYAGGEAPLINGVKMAIEEVNASGGIEGKNVKLVIEDTGSEQTGAVNALNRVVSLKPVGIMNTTLSSFVMAQQDIIKEGGIPTMTGAAAKPVVEQDNPYLFRIRSSDIIVPVAATLFALQDVGTEKVGVIYVNDETGKGWLDQIKGALQEKGLEPVAVEACGAEDKDFAPQLLAMDKAGAEAVIVAAHPALHVNIMKQRKQLGLSFAAIHSNSALLPTTLELLEPADAEGVYGTVDSLPPVQAHSKDWAAKYEAAFGLTADYSAAEYYDGMMMMLEAIKEVGTDAEAIADYLHGITDRQGMGNTWTFGQNGDGGTQVVIARISDLKLIEEKTIIVPR